MSRENYEQIKSSGKIKKELDLTVKSINGYYDKYCQELGIDPNKEMPNLSNEDKKKLAPVFSAKTNKLRDEIKTYMVLGYSEDEALKKVLPKAYALVKTASKLLWNKPHFDVQLKGGILLNEGYASQMATGEGKTLTATLPTYLNALLGKGAHVITSNAYLAKCNQEEMKELYEFLGLSCALVEERGKVSQEDLDAKMMSLLEGDLKKHTSAAKSEEERQILIKQYLSDKKNQDKINDARQKAYDALRKEDLLKRQKAYKADITYASSSAVAFDYLYDDIENDPNNIVQREPNFAVIDEVDSVLFDDATTPFTLSGTQTDEELAVTTEEVEESQYKIRTANNILAKIYRENQERIKINGKRDSIIFTKDEDSFKALERNETEQTRKYDMEKAIIIDEKNKVYKLTTLGETMAFQYHYGKEINKILKDHQDEIIRMQADGEPMFQEGLDYTISERGQVQMDSRAFARLVKSEAIPELTAAFDKFGLNELVNYQLELDNAIRAWFILEENVDYKLSVPSNPTSDNERTVSLVMNGRTAEGRVYSNGLQQAIEAKEKFLKRDITIRETKIKNTLASIPTASFFARYKKFAGMTGTSAVSAFKNLYELETQEVPRRKERIAKDYGERMYASKIEKYEAIFQETLKSHQKGQPVLISTTSIEESEKLFRYLDKRFKETGYKNVNIPVLNANVDKLEEEAKIVSKAGMPGAITISTEMAGRGTDIKLGGELTVPEVNDLVPIIADELVTSALNQLKKSGKVNDTNVAYFETQLKKKVLADKESLEKMAKKRQDMIKSQHTELKNQVENAGGLKVIGSGHFAYSRVDDQVKGRCGRQGNPGEIIFYNDPEDLLKVGVPRETVARFQKQAKETPIFEEPNKGYTPLSDAIYDAQRKTEYMVEMSIQQSQEMDIEVSKYRRMFKQQKDALKVNGDYIDTVEFMIEETVKTIIVGSSKDKDSHLTDDTRLKSADLDYEKLSSLTKEFIGIEISPEEIKNFRNLRELRQHLTTGALDLYRQKIEIEGKENVNAQSKELVDKMLNRTWNDFGDFIETIKYQDKLNKMTQYEGGMKLAPQVAQGYKHCVESQRAMLIREIINPNYKSKLQTKPRTEIYPVRVTPRGVERIEEDIPRTKREEKKEEKKARTKSTSNVVNLEPRPRMFTSGPTKLQTDTSRLGGMALTSEEDEIVSVDFEDSPKGKK